MDAGFDLRPGRDNYCVMGNPVAHSKSPLIHAAFAAQTGACLHYGRCLVEPGHLPEAVRAFRAAGGRGCNVTVPCKQEAFALADGLSERARLAGAVNTLSFSDEGGILGDNTDGAGLLRDMRDNLGWELGDKRVLLLGAGGAVRGVLGPLLEAGPGQLVIVNRNAARARELARLFAGHGPVSACAYAQLEGRFDILINGTSASLRGELPPLDGACLAPASRCYDMMYADRPTPFMLWASDQGAAEVADGLGMLVEQAAESFLIWRGVRPRTAPVIQSLRG